MYRPTKIATLVIALAVAIGAVESWSVVCGMTHEGTMDCCGNERSHGASEAAVSCCHGQSRTDAPAPAVVRPPQRDPDRNHFPAEATTAIAGPVAAPASGPFSLFSPAAAPRIRPPETLFALRTSLLL